MLRLWLRSHVMEPLLAATGPPPDLWIGHDQLELKELDGDETTETIARSTPDYRSGASSIVDGGRTRNYITPYSGKLRRLLLK